MSRWGLLVVCMIAVRALAEDARDFAALSDAQRRELVATSSREVLEQLMKDTPQAKLLAMGQRIIGGINSYRYRMVKQERVKGELLPEQTVDVFVREAPFAVRMHFMKGPGAGRKLLFNPATRAAEFRVHEAGFLSIAGAIWLSIDSSFAKADSNHTVREAGVGPLLGRMVWDTERARSLGGFPLVPQGWNAEGEYCASYLSPAATPPFDYAKTTICTDLAWGVPMKIEGYGPKGELLEKWHFFDFKPDPLTPEFFDPEKARL
jgi:hypothetical protein